MSRPRSIRDILGTAAGDRFLSSPSSADDLYRSLVGTPARDSLAAALGEKPPAALPWQAFDPFDVDEPDEFARGPTFVSSVRDDAIYSSRDDTNPGVGYPSCCRTLARVAKKFNDPNGYYRRVGVRPDVSMGEIKKALRTKYRRCHPDGWAPDADEFDYLREIATVLLNPARRARYDNLAPGEKWVDSRLRREMLKDPIVVEYMRKANAEAAAQPQGVFRRVEGAEETIRDGGLGDGGIFRQDRQQAMRDADYDTGNDFYDWFSEGQRPGDKIRAQLWYLHLLAVAPIFSFTRPMRVLLQDGGAPDWSDIGGILRIPRTWSIGRAEAFSLFTCVVV